MTTPEIKNESGTNSGWKNLELFPHEPSQRWLAHGLLIAVVLFCLVAFVWASFSNLEEVVAGEGKVVPSSQVQLVQNLEGGIVTEILVKEGDLVDKDQLLVRIDPTRFASSFGESRQTATALRAKIARLTAEAQNTRFIPPPEAAKENRDLAEHEQSLYLSRQKELTAKNDVLRQQLTQRRQELAELQSRRDKLQYTHDLVQKELNITAPMVKQGAISEVELLRLEREATRIKAELEGTTIGIPRAQAAIAEAQRKIDESELGFRNAAAAELNDAKAELAKLMETLPALEDRVSRTDVRSPMKGIVKRLKVQTIGGVLQPGSEIIEIVPVEDTLLVEARVRPADIAFLSVGQPATVKLSAYDFSIYGGADAKIEHISADSLETEKGDMYYLVRVRTTKNHIAHGGKMLPIFPGMTATVDILTGKKTVLQYLLKPINKAREKALREH